MSNPFSSTKTIVAENLTATQGIRDHVWDVSRRKRLCWKCQKDKPYREGTLTKSKGKGRTTFSSTDKFICHDCRPPKEEGNGS